MKGFQNQSGVCVTSKTIMTKKKEFSKLQSLGTVPVGRMSCIGIYFAAGTFSGGTGCGAL
jgi:hypothetical protein